MKKGFRLGYSGPCQAKTWIFSVRKTTVYLGNLFQRFAVLTVEHIFYIQVEFLLKAIVPIACCLSLWILVQKVPSSSLYLPLCNCKTVIRFPLEFPIAFLSQGWTNPVLSAFIHMSVSPTLLSLWWPGLDFFSSSKTNCICLHFCMHLGTYWPCQVRHKMHPRMNMPQKNDLSPPS